MKTWKNSSKIKFGKDNKIFHLSFDIAYILVLKIKWKIEKDPFEFL